MATFRIQRTHNLGLERARKVAARWTASAVQKHQVECSVTQGEQGDTVRFARSGFGGTMAVTANSFDVHVQLGFLYSPFLGKIESEAARQLDEALQKEEAKLQEAKLRSAQA